MNRNYTSRPRLEKAQNLTCNICSKIVRTCCSVPASHYLCVDCVYKKKFDKYAIKCDTCKVLFLPNNQYATMCTDCRCNILDECNDQREKEKLDSYNEEKDTIKCVGCMDEILKTDTKHFLLCLFNKYLYGYNECTFDKKFEDELTELCNDYLKKIDVL